MQADFPQRANWPASRRYGRPVTDRQRRFLAALDVRCGTNDGYHQHRQEGDLPCGDCNAAHEAHEKALAEAAAERAHRKCGTNDGWALHRRMRTEPCGPCVEARAEYERSQCGTYAGYRIHLRNRTTTCDACREANARYLADWQAANPEKVRRYQSDYYERHREQRVAYSATYRANNRPAA